MNLILLASAFCLNAQIKDPIGMEHEINKQMTIRRPRSDESVI